MLNMNLFPLEKEKVNDVDLITSALLVYDSNVFSEILHNNTNHNVAMHLDKCPLN